METFKQRREKWKPNNKQVTSFNKFQSYSICKVVTFTYVLKGLCAQFDLKQTNDGLNTVIDISKESDPPLLLGKQPSLTKKGSDNPLFQDYLSHLSSLEMQICLNVYNVYKEESDAVVYCPKETMHRLSTGESMCVYPDGWLSDHVSNSF